MRSLRFTLRADGSSDDMLLPVIRWVLAQHLPDVPADGQFARWLDSRGADEKGFANSLRVSLRLAPCDVFFIQRDVEAQMREMRIAEINEAVAQLEQEIGPLPHVIPLIPARMSEAWLLFDEQAIRFAAGNPSGKARLNLPKLNAVERLADPKQALDDAIRVASEATGRKLQKLQRRVQPRNVADYIDDFGPLRALPSFLAFEEEVKQFAELWPPEE